MSRELCRRKSKEIVREKCLGDFLGKRLGERTGEYLGKKTVWENDQEGEFVGKCRRFFWGIPGKRAKCTCPRKGTVPVNIQEIVKVNVREIFTEKCPRGTCNRNVWGALVNRQTHRHSAIDRL